MSSPSLLGRLSVNCLIAIPTYDRSTFNRNYLTDRGSHFEFSDVNANTTTIAMVKNLVFQKMLGDSQNPPRREWLKLYTGGFLNADFKPVGGPYRELADEKTLAQCGYIQTVPNDPTKPPSQDWYSNEIICISDKTCGNECGPNGVCKNVSRVIGGSTGWFTCSCNPGYTGMKCDSDVNMLTYIGLFVTTAPVSASIDNWSVYQYGSGPQKFSIRDFDSNKTIAELKQVINKSVFPQIAPNRLTLWVGNAIGAYNQFGSDTSRGKPWTAMQDSNTLTSYGYIGLGYGHCIVVTISCDPSCKQTCDMFGKCSCSTVCKNGGTCSSVSGLCQCPPAWAGPDCGTCTSQCKNGGACSSSTGKCECPPAWTGSDCGTCTAQCKNGGNCSNSTGLCECPPAWTGADCGTCTAKCKNGGTCSNQTGLCECPPAWTGTDCGTCTTQCKNGGQCSNDTGQCDCPPAWAGVDCGTCTAQCKNGGKCSNSTGLCECVPGWTGVDCGTCTKRCKNGGQCSNETGQCQCLQGWEGEDCGTCTKQCKNGGQCSNETGECECPTGWGGDDCGTCTRTCVNGGACSSDNTCACPVQKVCNGKGTCDAFNGACACQDGWTGADCSIPPPPPPLPPRYVCSSNGTCLTMKADVGGVSFSDIKSCSAQCCPSVNGQVCSGSGVCTNGACVCAKGKTGRACELQDCSVNTSCGMCSGAGCAWCPSTKKCEMPSSANAKTCPIKKAQCCEAPPAAGCFAPLSYRTGCAPDAAKGIVECSSSVTKDPSQTCCLSSEVSTLSTAACPAGWTADVSKDYCQTSINPLSPKYRVKCKRVCP